MDRRGVAWVLTVVCSFVAGCGGAKTNETDAPIVDPSGGAGGSGGDLSLSGTASGPNPTECNEPCGADQVCSHGACVDVTPCTVDDDCRNDTYCAGELGCQPWEAKDPAYDAACLYAPPPGVLQPAVRCEFTSAPPGDAFPNHVDVQSTPIVVNLNGTEQVPDLPPQPIGTPSIISNFTAPVPGSYTENLGIVRVLSGVDCSVEENLGGTDVDGDGSVDWTLSSASLAAGDLDGDGKPEIVAYGADGSTLAFTRKGASFTLLWKAKTAGGQTWIAPDTGRWAGASIHDLDDDGVPEVLREGAVIGGLDGVLRSESPVNYSSYSQGLFSVAANFDADPAIETTNGQFIWEWVGGAWVQEAGFPGANPQGPGQVAVADFGAFGTGAADEPEIAVASNDTVRIQALDGSFVMSPIDLPGGGGGPTTIADFDGDGLPELAVAGQAYYTVFDLDCGLATRPGGVCPAGPCDFGAACPAGIAWSKSTQDISSNVTGSSVFDFEDDGNDEVVYADECFVRVYDGKSGEVLFSQYHSSCTWYENPIIADVDGNFRADLVVPSNRACSPNNEGIACNNLTADGVDSQFAGLRCQADADCVSGACDAGFCRCAASAECCAAGDDAACVEEGFKCSPPPEGTPGSGNTCRAAHPHGLSGIRVYSDANDKWVRSRTVWNQHAYAVTHVNDDGTIPRTSEWTPNWKVAELNNFRANVTGAAGGQMAPDLTAGPSKFQCVDLSAVFSAPICNRGAAPVAPGVEVRFTTPDGVACTGTTTTTLNSEQCETVGCTWDATPTSAGAAVDVTVTPNPEHAVNECKHGNNEGRVPAVFCKPQT